MHAMLTHTLIQTGFCSGVHAGLGLSPDTDSMAFLTAATAGWRSRQRDLKDEATAAVAAATATGGYSSSAAIDDTTGVSAPLPVGVETANVPVQLAGPIITDDAAAASSTLSVSLPPPDQSSSVSDASTTTVISSGPLFTSSSHPASAGSASGVAPLLKRPSLPPLPARVFTSSRWSSLQRRCFIRSASAAPPPPLPLPPPTVGSKVSNGLLHNTSLQHVPPVLPVFPSSVGGGGGGGGGSGNGGASGGGEYAATAGVITATVAVTQASVGSASCGDVAALPRAPIEGDVTTKRLSLGDSALPGVTEHIGSASVSTIQPPPQPFKHQSSLLPSAAEYIPEAAAAASTPPLLLPQPPHAALSVELSVTASPVAAASVADVMISRMRVPSWRSPPPLTPQVSGTTTSTPAVLASVGNAGLSTVTYVGTTSGSSIVDNGINRTATRGGGSVGVLKINDGGGSSSITRSAAVPSSSPVRRAGFPTLPFTSLIGGTSSSIVNGGGGSGGSSSSGDYVFPWEGSPPIVDTMALRVSSYGLRLPYRHARMLLEARLKEGYRTTQEAVTDMIPSSRRAAATSSSSRAVKSVTASAKPYVVSGGERTLPQQQLTERGVAGGNGVIAADSCSSSHSHQPPRVGLVMEMLWQPNVTLRYSFRPATSSTPDTKADGTAALTSIKSSSSVVRAGGGSRAADGSVEGTSSSATSTIAHTVAAAASTAVRVHVDVIARDVFITLLAKLLEQRHAVLPSAATTSSRIHLTSTGKVLATKGAVAHAATISRGGGAGKSSGIHGEGGAVLPPSSAVLTSSTTANITTTTSSSSSSGSSSGAAVKGRMMAGRLSHDAVEYHRALALLSFIDVTKQVDGVIASLCDAPLWGAPGGVKPHSSFLGPHPPSLPVVEERRSHYLHTDQPVGKRPSSSRAAILTRTGSEATGSGSAASSGTPTPLSAAAAGSASSSAAPPSYRGGGSLSLHLPESLVRLYVPLASLSLGAWHRWLDVERLEVLGVDAGLFGLGDGERGVYQFHRTGRGGGGGGSDADSNSLSAIGPSYLSGGVCRPSVYERVLRILSRWADTELPRAEQAYSWAGATASVLAHHTTRHGVAGGSVATLSAHPSPTPIPHSTKTFSVVAQAADATGDADDSGTTTSAPFIKLIRVPALRRLLASSSSGTVIHAPSAPSSASELQSPSVDPRQVDSGGGGTASPLTGRQLVHQPQIAPLMGEELRQRRRADRPASVPTDRQTPLQQPQPQQQQQTPVVQPQQRHARNMGSDGMRKLSVERGVQAGTASGFTRGEGGGGVRAPQQSSSCQDRGGGAFSTGNGRSASDAMRSGEGPHLRLGLLPFVLVRVSVQQKAQISDQSDLAPMHGQNHPSLSDQQPHNPTPLQPAHSDRQQRRQSPQQLRDRRLVVVHIGFFGCPPPVRLQQLAALRAALTSADLPSAVAAATATHARSASVAYVTLAAFSPSPIVPGVKDAASRAVGAASAASDAGGSSASPLLKEDGSSTSASPSLKVDGSSTSQLDLTDVTAPVDHARRRSLTGVNNAGPCASPSPLPHPPLMIAPCPISRVLLPMIEDATSSDTDLGRREGSNGETSGAVGGGGGGNAPPYRLFSELQQPPRHHTHLHPHPPHTAVTTSPRRGYSGGIGGLGSGAAADAGLEESLCCGGTSIPSSLLESFLWNRAWEWRVELLGGTLALPTSTSRGPTPTTMHIDAARSGTDNCSSGSGADGEESTFTASRGQGGEDRAGSDGIGTTSLCAACCAKSIFQRLVALRIAPKSSAVLPETALVDPHTSDATSRSADASPAAVYTAPLVPSLSEWSLVDYFGAKISDPSVGEGNGRSGGRSNSANETASEADKTAVVCTSCGWAARTVSPSMAAATSSSVSAATGLPGSQAKTAPDAPPSTSSQQQLRGHQPQQTESPRGPPFLLLSAQFARVLRLALPAPPGPATIYSSSIAASNSSLSAASTTVTASAPAVTALSGVRDHSSGGNSSTASGSSHGGGGTGSSGGSVGVSGFITQTCVLQQSITVRLDFPPAARVIHSEFQPLQPPSANAGIVVQQLPGSGGHRSSDLCSPVVTASVSFYMEPQEGIISIRRLRQQKQQLQLHSQREPTSTTSYSGGAPLYRPTPATGSFQSADAPSELYPTVAPDTFPAEPTPTDLSDPIVTSSRGLYVSLCELTHQQDCGAVLAAIWWAAAAEPRSSAAATVFSTSANNLPSDPTIPAFYDSSGSRINALHNVPPAASAGKAFGTSSRTTASPVIGVAAPTPLSSSPLHPHPRGLGVRLSVRCVDALNHVMGVVSGWKSGPPLPSIAGQSAVGHSTVPPPSLSGGRLDNSRVITGVDPLALPLIYLPAILLAPPCPLSAPTIIEGARQPKQPPQAAVGLDRGGSRRPSMVEAEEHGEGVARLLCVRLRPCRGLGASCACSGSDGALPTSGLISSDGLGGEVAGGRGGVGMPLQRHPHAACGAAQIAL